MAERQGTVTVTVETRDSRRCCNLCSADLEERRCADGVKFFSLRFDTCIGQNIINIGLCQPHLTTLEKVIHQALG